MIAAVMTSHVLYLTKSCVVYTTVEQYNNHVNADIL